MAQSLKETYQKRQIERLKHRLPSIEDHLMMEAYDAQLLVEVMDQQDLDKVAAIVKKLDTIKSAAGNDLPALTDAIDQAQAELNKYTAGGPITAAWTKLKQKVGIDNPIVKIATFSNALEQGFKQLPQILKNNGIDIKNLNNDGNVRLVDAVARQLDKKSGQQGNPKSSGNTPPKMGEADAPTISTHDIESMHRSDSSKAAGQRVKNIVDQIRKSLAPSGIFGAFKKIPYVDGDALAQALSNSHVSTLIKISQAVTSGPQTSEIAPDLKSNVMGGGEAQNKATNPEQDTKPNSQTGSSAPSSTTTSPANSTATGQVPAQGPGEQRGGGSKPAKLEDGSVQSIANFISKQTKADPATTLKILTALNNNGKLRETVKK
jgi:hypothetical protein